MVNITHIEAMSVFEQGHFLDVAPLALGTVDIESLNLVKEGALGGEVLNGEPSWLTSPTSKPCPFSNKVTSSMLLHSLSVPSI